MERVQSFDLGAASRLPLGAFVLDLQRRELLNSAGRQVDLRRQALDVLLQLAGHAGHVVAKDELLARVWPDVVVTENSLVQAIADIRRALGDHEHALVRTVARRGYLLALPAAEIGEDSVPIATTATANRPSAAPLPAESPAPPEPPVAGIGAGTTEARRWRWTTLGALGLLAAVVLGRWLWDRAAGPAEGPPQIAVMAFHERGHGVEAASLAAGLSEDLVMELGRNQGLNVVANHSSFALSGKGLPTAELGRQLRAQYLIDGVVQRDGERLDLEVALIDVRADKVLWVARQQTEGGQVVRARDEIVAKVAGTLLSKMRETEKQRAARAAPKSLDVYALTQRGLALKHQFTPQATRDGRASLERALQLDPGYGPAWWALGFLNAVDAHLGLSGEWSRARMPEAIAQINRGIELDPYSSTAYQALKSAFDTGGHEEEALAAAQRAIDLGPGDAEAWLWHADAALKLRPPAEAMRSVLRARELDPLAPVYFDAVHAKVLWANAQPEAALQQAETCARKAPRFADCRLVQLLAYAHKGQVERAREQLEALQQAQFGRRHGCASYAGSPATFTNCLELAAAVGLPE